MNGKIQFSSDITGQTKIPANTNSFTRVLASAVMQEKENKATRIGSENVTHNSQNIIRKFQNY